MVVSTGSLWYFRIPLFIFKRLQDMSPNQNYFKGHVGPSVKTAILRVLLSIFLPWILKLHFFSFQREKIPEEYFEHDPEHEFIYRFVRTLFSAALLTAECAVVTLVRYFFFHKASVEISVLYTWYGPVFPK